MFSYDRIKGKITFEQIVKRMKDDLKNPPNKVEGSFASDNIQAVAKELLKYYDYIDFLQDQHYADTAEGEFLDAKGREVGVFRKQATRATGYCTFEGRPNIFIPNGFRVSSDNNNYFTTDSGYIGKNGKVELPIEAELEGVDGNTIEESIYNFDSLSGLRRVYNINPVSSGTDIEDDESFRERILLRMRNPGTSGNQYHYMHWAMEVDGVGRVRVFPIWNGPGTVKVSILDSNQRVASEDLIQKVKHHIDNDGDRKGESLAPIGALLTVSTATIKKIKIEGKILFEYGSKLTKEEVSEQLKKQVQEYIDKYISYKSSRLTVAKVIDILYNIEGIQDIINLTINGVNDSVGFEAEEIPFIESVVLE